MSLAAPVGGGVTRIIAYGAMSVSGVARREGCMPTAQTGGAISSQHQFSRRKMLSVTKNWRPEPSQMIVRARIRMGLARLPSSWCIEW